MNFLNNLIDCLKIIYHKTRTNAREKKYMYFSRKEKLYFYKGEDS